MMGSMLKLMETILKRMEIILDVTCWAPGTVMVFCGPHCELTERDDGSAASRSAASLIGSALTAGAPRSDDEGEGAEETNGLSTIRTR